MLDQSFADLELVVVDDGSTDGTAAVVEQFTDPRVRLVRGQHQGVVAASNRGTELTSSAYVARMDADDFMYPNKLELQLAYLIENKLGAVGCQVRIVDPSHRAVASMQRYERWINEETLDSEAIAALRFVEFPLVNPTILAVREYFELGCQANEMPEDYDLMLRAAAQGMRFGKVPQVLFDWTDHPERLTRNSTCYADSAFMRCRRQHLLAGPLAGVRQVDLWGVGLAGKEWLRWLLGQGIAVRRAFDIDYRKVGQEIHGVCVLHSDEMTPADGTLLVVAVGAEGARAVIEPQVRANGYVVGRDAWFVA